MHLVELRPVGLDSVARSEVAAEPDGRFLFDGYSVACGGGAVCTGLLPLAKERTVLASQDVSMTFWGLGVQGLSATALARARTSFGGEGSWPRYGDEFEAMLAYAQLVRGSVRFRAGRQEIRSGLGFAGFDGASGSLQSGGFRFEGYGGRSLARGLRQPANGAARGFDDFFVDQGVYLFGGAATMRRYGLAVTGRYQREILADRSGLDSERASVDFSTVMPRARVTGSLDYDFGYQRTGKGHLTVSAPLSGGRWLVEASARRYVPYFQLSTIWGLFDPVSYSEVVGRVAWSGTPRLGLWFAGGRRSYGDTGATVVLQPLSDSGWRGDAGLLWEPSPGWGITARYEVEWGPGAFLNSVDASARWAAFERLGVRVNVLTFQQIEEYRLGQGRAFGGGGTIDYAVNDRIDAVAGFSLTRHRDGGTVYTSPWNQTRAWTSLRWSVGRDPGLANRGRTR